MMVEPEACDNMGLLVQAELDGELDAAAAAALATHLEGCAGCAALKAELSGLVSQVRAGVTRYAAPPALRGAIMAQQTSPRRRRLPWTHAVSFGAGLAMAASVAVAVLPGRDQASDVVGAHIRALQPGHLVDVASTDQHTVKPWFDGRLDFAPPVQDLAKQRFPLVGGRLDYLDGRPVAALVYGRDKHFINVFVWPGSAVAETDQQVQGYNVLGWSQAGMNFRAVSDLNRTELGEFMALLRQPAR